MAVGANFRVTDNTGLSEELDCLREAGQRSLQMPPFPCGDLLRRLSVSFPPALWITCLCWGNGAHTNMTRPVRIPNGLA